MLTIWLRAVSQISRWTLLFLTRLGMNVLWRWKSAPALKDTEDHLARNVTKGTRGLPLGFTWALVGGVIATVTPAAVTQRPAGVCNVSITLLAQDVSAVKMVSTETPSRVVLRPVSPAPALESLLITNSPRPAIWILTASRPVTTVLLDSLADAVKDVLQDTLVIQCLDRAVKLAMDVMSAITVTKEGMKAAIVVCATAR